jgi:hypothetical protein
VAEEFLGAWDFQRLYGRWQPLSPVEVRRIFDGAPFPWWVAGGWSLELGGPPARTHEDIDVVVLARDTDAARAWLARWHIWEPDPTGMRPLRAGDDPRPGQEQWWLRRDAWSPWVMDVLLTPSDGADWLYKRDHAVRRPLADMVRYGDDGVPYQRPEVTLLLKAKHAREKDVADLDRVWPVLDVGARGWLLGALARTLPDHPWLSRLAAAGG